MTVRKACFSTQLVLALLLPVVLLLASPAHAATVTYVCAKGDWNTPACWSGGAVPGSGDTAIVSGVTVAINATPPNPGILQIGGGTRIDIADGHSLTVQNAMTLTSPDHPNFQHIQFIGPPSGQGSIGFAPGATLSIALASQGQLQLAHNLTFELPGPGAATAWTSGTIVFEGASGRVTLVVPPDAIFPLLDGGTLYASTVSDRVLNQGTIVKSGPGRTNISPLLFNSGLVDHRQGTLGASSGFTRMTQAAGETAVASGASFEADLTLSGGTLSGRGVVTYVTNNGGKVAPGAPDERGTLTVSGVYTQGAGGTLEIDINGASLGSGGPTGYDRLAVGGGQGSADLAGTLAIVNGPSFVPQATDVFTILTRSSGAGTFATITGAETTAGRYEASYAATEVTLGFDPDTSASADLALTKTDSSDPVAVGGTLTYTLEVSNAGPDAAAGVQVTDALPGDVTFESAITSQGTCSHASGTVICDLGSLASGAGATVTIEVAPESAGTVTNAASVSSAINDPSSGNNSDSEDTLVQASQTGTIVVHAAGNVAAGIFTDPLGSVQLIEIGESRTFADLLVGPYTVEAGGVANADEEISCSDPDGGTTVTGKRAAIDLDAGETVECTITWTRRVGTIVVHAAGNVAAGIFTDPLGSVQLIEIGQSRTFADLLVGPYTVEAGGVANADEEISCSDPDGGTTVTGKRAAIDLDAGETVECTITWTRDSAPPTLVVPADMTVDATSPSGAAVSYSATASDDVDQSPAVSCVSASGNVFPIGTTMVTCTATDDAANSSSATFTITVRGAAAQVVALIDETLAYLGLSALPAALRAPLTAIANALVANNRPAACLALNAYRVVVAATPTRLLSAAEKAELRAGANRIRAVIGCT
jgi:uncharacterized repeat protein (TIGR01451 family)